MLAPKSKLPILGGRPLPGMRLPAIPLCGQISVRPVVVSVRTAVGKFRLE